MEINSVNGLANTNINNQYMNIQREEEKTSSFKDAFENALNKGEDEEIMKAAKDMETYFINQLFKEMRKTTNNQEGFFKKSYAQKMFEEMLDEEYSKAASEAGGIGLAEAIYEDIKNKM